MINGLGAVWRGIGLRTLRWRGATGLLVWSCTTLEGVARRLEFVVRASNVDFESSDGVVELEDAGCVIELERGA